MKIKELTDMIFDKIIIYRLHGDIFEDIFEDIYKGNTNNIPLDVLEMEVRSIGVSKKGVIDIQVF